MLEPYTPAYAAQTAYAYTFTVDQRCNAVAHSKHNTAAQ